MVKDRRTRRPSMVLLALLAVGAVTGAAPTAFRVADAPERGAFNVGESRADVAPTPDGAGLRLEFTLPPGTAAGLWTKGYPADLDAASVDIARVAVPRVEGPVEGLNATLEIKGSAGVQRIPIGLADRGDTADVFVDWSAVGTLSEVVVSVGRSGDGGPISGAIDLDIRFERLSWARRIGTSPPARVGAAFALAAMAAALAGLVAAAARLVRGTPESGPVEVESRRFRGIRRDVCLGVGAAAIAAIGIGIDAIGGLGRLDVGGWPMVAALAGIAVGAWFKVGLTGSAPTVREVFADGFATGLVAASVAPLAILQPPGSWSDLLLLSQPVAMLVAVLYHAANARAIAATGRHLSTIVGAMIVGTPYAVGLLLVIEVPSLAAALGGLGGSESAWAVAAGRVIALFAFNEVVANALGLATRRSPLRGLRSHLALLAVATAAIAGYAVAGWGSGSWVAGLPAIARFAAVVGATMLSQAGLWAEVYLLTGLVIDAIHGTAPSADSTVGHPLQGLRKGMVYSGTFMAILNGLALLIDWGPTYRIAEDFPIPVAALFGAVAFPLVKTIIETFDGSQAFFRRAGKSYSKPALYARGAVVGLGVGLAMTRGLPDLSTWTRAGFGLVVGALAFAGVDLLGVAIGRARPRSARVYAVHALLGGAIGAGIGFYFDAAQVAVVVAKFHRYVSVGREPVGFDVRPLLSKWGLIDLGQVTGGVGLLFAEALAGVIGWSIPAWMFAINRTFMAAYFRREAGPIRALFTRSGMTQLVQNMLEVLRWGLWMSPIINSFLRMTGEPTWYNQDGAIRTAVATYHDLTMGQAAFREWSLGVFTALLAYDWVRILIWLDHYGLRVATLVNLSFLGMDRLDDRLSRFLAPDATARCIPEGVKRFTTWAPLLIPFYIPRGGAWDYAWETSQAIQARGGGGLLAAIVAMPVAEQGLLFAVASAVATAGFAAVRLVKNRPGRTTLAVYTLANADYEVTLKGNGESYSVSTPRGYDLTRRSYDLLDPAGRALFLVETGDEPRSWPILGNAPAGLAGPSTITRDDRSLLVDNASNGVRATVEITLPGVGDSAELWTVRLENLDDRPRRLAVVPYLEWVLNRPDADRGHTQYNRLFAEMEYADGLHAVIARDKHAKATGLLASDLAPDGFLTARVDFLGRARSLWDARALETLEFTGAADTDAHPTFDPIASLLVGVDLPPRGASTVRFLVGFARDKADAGRLVSAHLGVAGAASVPATFRRKEHHPIGHGATPDGTPRPYCDFSDDGRTMTVRTPFTPRPFDQTLSNALGHVVSVTNRGLHTSSSVNAQQNRLTPDWSDTVTREVPGEAFYIYEPESREWFSPTYHPINDPDASHEATFSVDGTARFRSTKGTIESDLTVFVPPDEPTGVYRLTIRNRGNTSRRLRVAPYFQMVLAGQPEFSGPLKVDRDDSLGAVFFENPRNTFRSGPAFVAMAGATGIVVTARGRFFGDGRDATRPELVERGRPPDGPTVDDRPVAAFLVDVEVPAGGESTLVVLLGQADDRGTAEAVVRRYRDPAASIASLDATRSWWLALMGTLTVETDAPEFDRYLDWLKYQALAERIWARRGFYQASGAFGFRDQLQDSVNLIWVDPAIARRQILLHAGQQFLEGDVVHWFHRLQDGRTGFVGRTHASDNLLWLAWGVVDYVGETGDESILDERASYLESEQPLAPLPEGKHGIGFDPLRSPVDDPVYRHCLRAIDLVLDARMGAHGLPLIGTGDWNDGLDEIGSEGRGESVWLGFFLYYILDRFIPLVGPRDGDGRRAHYVDRLDRLREALQRTWRGDRYLRAFHDDGTEIGVAGSGIWEIDALTAAWAVMTGIDPDRGRVVFETALNVLERDTTILLGYPPLREDSTPYLGRSSGYPEGVRENGMYCHGVQWLVGAARILADRAESEGREADAHAYRATAYRLWLKITAIPHARGDEIETYGGQPNKQAADMVTTFEPGRMIWNGYTGAAGWLFRQAIEGVLGFRLDRGMVVTPAGPDDPADGPTPSLFARDTSISPFGGPEIASPPLIPVGRGTPP